jgi:hypothetical protein
MNIKHENTKRALKDEPLYATRQWLCRLRIHTWLMWDTPLKSRRGVYDYVEQYRQCGCCGKVERREIAKV